jgi:hypothetical protein
MSLNKQTTLEAETQDAIQKLLDRAQKGDQRVIPVLKEILDENPEIWKRHGDLSKVSRDCLLGWISCENLLVRESIERVLQEMRTSLSKDTGSPVEALLIERVLIAWLEVHQSDMEVALYAGKTATPEGRQAQRRHDLANHRYHAALKLLVILQKHLKPTPSLYEMAMGGENGGSRINLRPGAARVQEGEPVLN